MERNIPAQLEALNGRMTQPHTQRGDEIHENNNRIHTPFTLKRNMKIPDVQQPDQEGINTYGISQLSQQVIETNKDTGKTAQRTYWLLLITTIAAVHLITNQRKENYQNSEKKTKNPKLAAPTCTCMKRKAPGQIKLSPTGYSHPAASSTNTIKPVMSYVTTGETRAATHEVYGDTALRRKAPGSPARGQTLPRSTGHQPTHSPPHNS